MIRLMGFVTGTAVAIGGLLLLFGLPEVPETPTEPQVEDTAPAVEAADAENTMTELVAAAEPDVSEPEAPVPVAATGPAPVPDVEPAPSVSDTMAVSEDVAPLVEEPVAPTPMPEPEIAVADDAPPRQLQWYAFWSPFRSQIAANGFVSRLESVTGFDYRVVQVDTGVYEVAVGYGDDDERRRKLQAIAAATGLEVPDS